MRLVHYSLWEKLCRGPCEMPKVLCLQGGNGAKDISKVVPWEVSVWLLRDHGWHWSSGEETGGGPGGVSSSNPLLAVPNGGVRKDQENIFHFRFDGLILSGRSRSEQGFCFFAGTFHATVHENQFTLWRNHALVPFALAVSCNHRTMQQDSEGRLVGNKALSEKWSLTWAHGFSQCVEVKMSQNAADTSLSLEVFQTTLAHQTDDAVQGLRLHMERAVSANSLVANRLPIFLRPFRVLAGRLSHLLKLVLCMVRVCSVCGCPCSQSFYFNFFVLQGGEELVHLFFHLFVLQNCLWSSPGPRGLSQAVVILLGVSQVLRW